MSGLRRLGEICRVVRVVAYSQWVQVETLARCGAGWQPARRLATAAVRCQRGIWPIDNRPDPEGTPAKLPHESPRCLAYTYARIQTVLLMNRLGVHFCVAHPPIRFRLTPITRKRAPPRRMEPFELLQQVSGANPMGGSRDRRSADPRRCRSFQRRRWATRR